MSDYHTNALNDSLRKFSENRPLLAAVGHLSESSSIINSELMKTVLAEIPAFSESRNPQVLPDLARHGPEHTSEILRLLSGGLVGDFDFVRDHARRRAEQHFPLEATLHAYRCGHKVFSRWVREATLSAVSSPQDAQRIVADVADFTMEYTDAISTIAASTYLSQIRLLASVAGDERAELLTILLDGYDESDRRVTNILKSAGYLDQRQSFCVALAQPVDPAEMLNPARARRLADSIDEILQVSHVKCVIDVRQNKVVIVFSDARRVSGWTAPRTALAKKIVSELLKVGNAALVGVSNDVQSTSQIPIAQKEAALALDLADVTHRVMQFSGIPVQMLLLHLAGEKLQRSLPGWSAEFFKNDDKSGGSLVETLQAYATSDMNVLRSAELLSVHPNTIYFRLQRILDITGLDPKSYHALTDLLIVAECRPKSSLEKAG